MNRKALVILLTCLMAISAGSFFTWKAVEANTLEDLYDQAKQAFEEEKYEESIPLYQEVLSEDASHKDAIYELAQAYLAVGETKKATTTLQQGIYKQPEAQSFYLLLSDIFLDQQKIDDAYDTLKKGQNLDSSELKKAYQQLKDNITIHTERMRVQKDEDRQIALAWESEEGEVVPLQAEWTMEDDDIGDLSKLEESNEMLFSADQLGKTTLEVDWKSVNQSFDMEVVDQLLSEINLTPEEIEPLAVGETITLSVTGADASGEDMEFDPEWELKKDLFTIESDEEKSVVLTASEPGKDILTISYEDFTEEIELIVEGEGESYVQTHVDGEGRIAILPESETYERGQEIQLQAIGEEDWKFVRWEGDIDGTRNPVQHVLEGNISVTAVFETDTHDLNLAITGDGEVYRDSLSTTFTHNETISLRARSQPGWTFEGWEGDVSTGESDIELLMDDDKSLRAIFVEDEDNQEEEENKQEENESTEHDEEEEKQPEPTTYQLNLSKNGQGSIQKNKSGSTFSSGTKVQLTAAAKEGWSFTGWGGSASSSRSSITVTMDSNKSISANFKKKPTPSPDPEPEPDPEPTPEPEPEPEPQTYSLTMGTAGKGTIQASAKTVKAGQSISIQAIPSDGWTFVRWEGATSGSSASASITMDSNKEVTAVFKQVEEEESEAEE